jgi:2'-5' RNA ligase
MWFQHPRDLPIFTYQTIRYMMMDDTIRLGLSMRIAPLLSAEFAYKEGNQWIEGIEADKPEVKEYVETQLDNIWNNGIDKILTSQIWGWSCGEIKYKVNTGKSRVEFDALLDRRPEHCSPLLRDGELAAVRVRGVGGHGKSDLACPGKGYWSSFNAESGSLYGTPILYGAYSAFADKWFNGGALDVRRLFMHADAYGGTKIGYPQGSTNINGQSIPNRDIAQQVAEQKKSGEVITYPLIYDKDGRELWRIDDPHVTPNPSHILEYPDKLDISMLRGMEIPDDVVTSAGGGGAWQGKQVPMQAFYTGLNRWGVEVVSMIVRQILEPLVMWQFGRAEEFNCRLKPLEIQAMEQQTQGQPQPTEATPPGVPGPDAMGGDMGGGMGGGMPGEEDPFNGLLGGMGGDPAMMSSERVTIRDRVNDMIDKRIDRPQSLSQDITTCIRDEIQKAVGGLGMLAKEEDYGASSIIGYLPPESQGALASFVMNNISPSDLHDKGYETDYHITICHGLNSQDSSQAEHVLKGQGPVAAMVRGVGMFSCDDFDVVYAAVESVGVTAMNARLKNAVPNTQTHDTYTPHVTLAYVRKGLGSQYTTALADFNHGSVVFDTVVFSDQQGKGTFISLAGPVQFSSDKPRSVMQTAVDDCVRR